MRDYKREYAQYHARPEQKRNRAARNLWNRRLKGKVPPGKEIDHRRPLMNGGGNSRGNIRFRSISANRADKSAVKTAMWDAFEDELIKIARYSDLTEMEKQAIFKQLKRGYGALQDGINEQYLRGITRMGLDPLEAHGLLEGGMLAGTHGGAMAAAKNMLAGGAVLAAKKKGGKVLGGTARALGNTFGEDMGIGGMLSSQSAARGAGGANLANNITSYGARPSYEGMIDAISSAF